MSAQTEEADEEESAPSSPLDDEEYLREQYHEEGRTQADLAEEHGVTSSTVSHYMDKHEVETNAYSVTDERLDDEEWLEEKYIEEEQTMMEIAEEVGCSDGTVMRRLRAAGIETSRGSGDEDKGGEDDGED